MIREKIVIAGVGNTFYGKHPGRDRIDLIVEATRKAVDDANIAKEMIDGVFVKMANAEPTILYGQKVAEALGLRPDIGCCLDQGGAANIGLITYAALAIEAGMINIALVCYGDTARTGSRSVYHRPRGDDALVGWYSTAAGYAMIHQAYCNRYQPRAEEFGVISVQARANALNNPNAHLRMPLTMDDYLASPFVVQPLRRDDCCLVSDGGAAILLMSAQRARELGQHAAVPILGLGQGQESWDVHLRADLLRTKAQDSAKRAFHMAGMTPADISVAQIYDCFTVTVLQTLEDYGLAPRGQAGAKCLADGIGLDDWLPLNTSGGLLAESGTPGLQLIIEGVCQMRGDARLQVKSPRACIVSNQGGTMHTHATMILGTPL